MEIISVRENTPFNTLAIEIDAEPDISMLNEIVANTYPGEGYVSRRPETAIGPGFIEVVYGGGDNDYSVIRPNETGWLVLTEKHASFYAGNRVWFEYERIQNV